MEEFALGTRVLWGEGGLHALRELRGLRVLVVSDGFLAGSGLLAPVLEELRDCETAVFDGVAGEPTLRQVAEGVVALNRLDAQAVVAFGGGSAMDCAKALGYCTGKNLPLWCIPTTAGTGSEVTAFSVLTDEASGVKYPLVDPALLPEVAILDSRFLADIPAQVTADAGVDVLTHGLEAYVSVRANPFTDALAEKAVTLAYKALPAAWRGDSQGKNTMLLASALAGMAFNAAGLGVCHGLAHALGHRIKVPHGRVNGVLLPQVIEGNSQVPAAARKYARLAQLCGLSANPRALAGGIRRLCRRLEMPERLAGEADLAQVAADALGDRCTADNPKAFTAVELELLLREALG